MVWRLILASSIFTATLLSATGCSQSYNGAMGISSENRQSLAAYEKFKREREQRLHATRAESAQQANPVVSLDIAQEAVQMAESHAPAPQQQEQQAESAVFTEPHPIASVAQFADSSGRSMGQLGLFGQMDGQSATDNAQGLDNLSRITFSSEGSDFDPDIAPTGKWMVFASTRHRQTPDLYVKRVDGTTVTQLTNEPSREVMPAFSPDGQRIAFASDRSGSFDIYIMDARGGKAMQVTNGSTQDLHPSFSPDGTKLVYCTFGGPSGQWEMVVVDLQNPGAKKFIGHGLFPTWSPTGDTILFQRARQRGTRWFSIWTIDLIDGEASAPTEIAASANAAIITPDWSPDGKHIVFCTVIDPVADEQDRPAHADVWMVNTDGTGRVRLTSGRFANLQPAWANDGAIYFVSNRTAENAENIWAVRPERAIELATPGSRSETPSAMVTE